MTQHFVVLSKHCHQLLRGKARESAGRYSYISVSNGHGAFFFVELHGNVQQTTKHLH